MKKRGTPMNALRISLFGRFDVRCEQRVVTGLDTRKVQKLFCYLLLYRAYPHPREALATLLWDDDDVNRPNRCLRKTIWQLRTALDSQTESFSGRVLLVEPEWVQINPQAPIWLDVAVFEQAFNHVQNVPGKELDAESVQMLKRAIDLYQGGLQESWYQDWYLYECERFQHMYLIMLDKLMDYCELHGHYELGLTYGAFILRCDKARERTHRRLMRLHCLNGDRTAALRQYARCVRTLEEELSVKPTAHTVRLYQQIQTDRTIDLAPTPAVANKTPEPPFSPLPNVLEHLKQVQLALTDLQRQVHQHVQALELAINDPR